MGNDPKADTVDLLQTNIRGSNLVDENGNSISYVVTYAQPPSTLVKDYFKDKNLDAVLTVGRSSTNPNRHTQNMPVRYNNILPIGIWTKDRSQSGGKPIVVGQNLMWLFLVELRYVLRTNASIQRDDGETEEVLEVAGIKLYHTEVNILFEDWT